MYPTTQVAAASRAKIEYHRSRQTFWTDEKEAAHLKITTSTVQITEYPVTGGVRVQATIDPTLQARYDECSTKLKHHTEAVRDYERWASILDANPQETVCLDIHYFGLVNPE